LHALSPQVVEAETGFREHLYRLEANMTKIVPIESIVSKIIFLRGEKVLLDRDLAELYDVGTKQLKRAVRRHISRFPEDFMFYLTKEEFNNLRCQLGTSS